MHRMISLYGTVQAVMLGQKMRNTMKLMCDLVKNHKKFAGSCLLLSSSFVVTSTDSNSFMWMKIGGREKTRKRRRKVSVRT